jgi:UDP-N-acetyl-D-mannosaminuronate dehydrogenase
MPTSRTPIKVSVLTAAFGEKRFIGACVGSPSILLRNLLAEKGVECSMYDPYIDTLAPTGVGLYVIGTNHDEFLNFEFPRGSIVIDPWGMIKDIDGVKVIRVGRNE